MESLLDKIKKHFDNEYLTITGTKGIFGSDKKIKAVVVIIDRGEYGYDKLNGSPLSDNRRLVVIDENEKILFPKTTDDLINYGWGAADHFLSSEVVFRTLSDIQLQSGVASGRYKSSEDSLIISGNSFVYEYANGYQALYKGDTQEALTPRFNSLSRSYAHIPDSALKIAIARLLREYSGSYVATLTESSNITNDEPSCYDLTYSAYGLIDQFGNPISKFGFLDYVGAYRYISYDSWPDEINKKLFEIVSLHARLRQQLGSYTPDADEVERSMRITPIQQ